MAIQPTADPACEDGFSVRAFRIFAFFDTQFAVVTIVMTPYLTCTRYRN